MTDDRIDKLERPCDATTAWMASFFDMDDLAKTPEGWKIDNCNIGWVGAPDWLVEAIQKQEVIR